MTKNQSTHSTTTNAQPMLELSHLTKKFDTLTAVNDLSLTIKPGETFGLLGPNGSGKTTTIRLLNGLIRPTAGNATLNGYSILEDLPQIKAITGLLAESPGIYDKLTPYEFLQFIGSLYQVPRTILSERIQELLVFFSLADKRDILIENFSTGMKQKLLLAASLIHDPEIIFLDEPTSGLDPKAGTVVKDLIHDLTKDLGKTIIISSHILSLVEELCDRIAIIHHGTLVALGTVDEIVVQTDSINLEEAFIKLTGGANKPKMFNWGTSS